MTEAASNSVLDWRDRSLYPEEPEQLDEAQWRWEFIRRDETYRNIWDRGNDLLPEGGLLRAPSKISDATTLSERYGMRLVLSPDMAWDENSMSSVGWRPPPGQIFSEEDHEAALAMIEVADPPADEKRLMVLASMSAKFGGGASWKWNSSAVRASFNLNLPIKPQLERVEMLLEKEQRKIRQRPSSPKLTGAARRLWPLYLRLIDASHAGARPMEIFRHLEEEQAEEIEDAANEASKIAGMISAAQKVQEKIIFNL